MKVKFSLIFVFCTIVLLGCSTTNNISNNYSTNNRSKNTSFQVFYDENGIPRSKDNLFIVNLAEIGGEAYVKNVTDTSIKVYYEKDGKWVIIGTVKNNEGVLLSKSKYTNIKYICLEYLGTDFKSFSISVEKSFLYPNIILGCPAPLWNGESYGKLADEIVRENIENKDIKFIIQSIKTSSPNSAGGVDIGIKFWNLSEKTIKYVYFTVEAYNRVGDITVSTINGKSLATVQVTDFIEKNQSFNAYWENVWYNNSISYFRIKNIRIVYKDNSESIIKENTISSILGINPITCKIFENDDITIYCSYNEGRVYYNVSSNLSFDKFAIHFETNPKTLYSKLEKNIDIEFKDFSKVETLWNENSIQATHPNYKNGLLYELLSMEITYKHNGEAETILKISDEKSLGKIKNYAYVIESLGLR